LEGTTAYKDPPINNVRRATCQPFAQGRWERYRSVWLGCRQTPVRLRHRVHFRPAAGQARVCAVSLDGRQGRKKTQLKPCRTITGRAHCASLLPARYKSCHWAGCRLRDGPKAPRQPAKPLLNRLPPPWSRNPGRRSGRQR